MTTPAIVKQTRARASEKAIEAVLTAAKRAGYPVQKMLIHGGQVEVQFGHVEAANDDADDGGLKQW